MSKFIRILLIWLPLVAFFFLQFMLRVSPNVMADAILAHFQINATNFGMLMSLYYMGYACMQIPIGLLLDMYGARYIACIGALLCAVGGFLFAYTDHWSVGLFARLIIGMGSSGAFISASKVIRLWFPEKYFSLFVACTVTLGMMGAFAGGKPTAVLVEAYGWQKTLIFISLITLLVGISIFALVKNTPAEDSMREQFFQKDFWLNFFQILKEKNILWIAFLGALLTGPLCAFADVWGVSYLVHVYGLEKTDAAEACSSIYIGFAIGGPILAFIASQYNIYKRLIALSGISMAAALLIIMFGGIAYKILVTTCFFMGMFCAYQILLFSLVLESIPKKISGIMLGCINTINMLSGLFFLPIIGLLLDAFWEGESAGGVRLYSSFAYNIAFSTILVGLVSGSIGFLLLKEKKI